VFSFPRPSGRGKEPDRQVDPLERKCLSFPSLSVHSLKKERKKLEDEGHALCREKALAERGWCLSCGSEGLVVIYLV
jgi:hypothetical protein